MQKKTLTLSITVSALLFALFAVFILLSDKSLQLLTIIKLFWAALISILLFLMLSTGKTFVYRAAFFIITAWAFVITYKINIHSLKNFFPSETVSLTPYCHIAQSSTFFNSIRNIYLGLASGNPALWLPLSAGVLWLLATLLIGQGFCSWGCFYGGLDESFSRMNRSKTTFASKIPSFLRDLPSAILIISLILSFINILPFFCLWICPLKMSCGFLDSNQAIKIIQQVSFITIGIMFIILLPLLFKKRTFCAYICPFGSWQAFFGLVCPFRITIDKQKCTQCLLCEQSCPTKVITKEDISLSRISNYCNRCGKCVDVCPEGAISYTIFHKDIPKNPFIDARVLFIFMALLLGGSISLLFVPKALLILFGITP